MICAVRLRTFFSALLLAIALTVSLVSTGNLSALATPLTPEASAYEVDKSDQHITDRAKLQEKAQLETEVRQKSGSRAKRVEQSAIKEDKNTFERAADTVREKLNLDEPVPQSTKDFLNSVKGE